jgi:hypothetical protein
MVDTDMIRFNKQGNCSIILETWMYYHEEHSLICLEDLSRSSCSMGSMLNMILIDWIIHYIRIKRGYRSVTISLFKDNEHQQYC